MGAFGLTDGEKLICIVLAVLSWLAIARQMRRDRQNYASICILIAGAAVFLFVAYLGVAVQIPVLR
jgi:uncharacterized membrane protein YidH (DUF202 family)